MPAFEPVPCRRVVAKAAALDALCAALDLADGGAGGYVALRIAPDELFIVGRQSVGRTPGVDDPHAIDVAEAGLSGAWLEAAAVTSFLTRATDWSIAPARPLLLQGMAAGVPVKVHMAEDGTALVVVPTPLAHDLEERWR